MSRHLDLIEFADGIAVRLTPRLPVPPGPHYPGDLLRCGHGSPLIFDKHEYGYRLALTVVDDIEITRGCAADDIPRCGCWLQLVDGGQITPIKRLMVAQVSPK